MKRTIAAFALVLLLAGPVAAQSQKGASEVAFSGFSWAPGELVEINADKMSLSLNSREAEFNGNVLVKKGKSQIYCDRLVVKYLESGQIDRLKAKGSVKLIEGKSFATGDELEYFKSKDTITLSGDPKLSSEGQMVLGDSMTFDLAKSRLLVANPRIQFSKEKNESGKK
jgi:lipopolysaccharide export system protein LptA